MREFYLAIKAKVEAGNYILEEMAEELQLAYENSRITLVQHDELLAALKVFINPDYASKYPSNYDLKQDNDLTKHDMSIVELYELILQSAAMTLQENSAITNASSSAIANSYARLIIKNMRTLESVPVIIVNDVTKKLAELQ